MKIVDNTTKTTTFGTLDEGDVFRDADGVLLMKMGRIDSTGGVLYNSVALFDGAPLGFEVSERVTKIERAVLTLG
jgi:hypothetical protein